MPVIGLGTCVIPATAKPEHMEDNAKAGVRAHAGREAAGENGGVLERMAGAACCKCF